MPHDLAEVMRRLSSCMRAGVRATSMPPHWVSTPISLYWRMLSSVRNAISLVWSTGKMKFEAWPVEPPGLGSGPLSISTMSRQPEPARWQTRLLPTMPAPMTTTLADVGSVLIASLSCGAVWWCCQWAGVLRWRATSASKPSTCEDMIEAARSASPSRMARSRSRFSLDRLLEVVTLSSARNQIRSACM